MAEEFSLRCMFRRIPVGELSVGEAGSARSASEFAISEFAPACEPLSGTVALPATPAPTWAKAGREITVAKIAAVNAVNVRFIELSPSEGAAVGAAQGSDGGKSEPV